MSPPATTSVPESAPPSPRPVRRPDRLARRTWRGRLLFPFLLPVLAAATAASGQTDTEAQEAAEAAERGTPTAPVEIDDRVLFEVRGMRAYPAEERAQAIRDRILKVAADPTITTDTLTLADSEHHTAIMAGGVRLLAVLDADASLEGLPRRLLAEAYMGRVRSSIDSYRSARTAEHLIRQAWIALLATFVALLLAALVVTLHRRLVALAERRFRARVKALSVKSFELVRAERIWHGFLTGFRYVRLFLVLLVALGWAEVVLGLFPWTRKLSTNLLGYLVSPLRTMATAIVGSIPDLLFLAVLVVVVRYLLKLARLFFAGVADGKVHVANLPPEWARPTYGLVRVGVVAFAAVVAYPYIPGSRSAAFKGVSLLLGVLVSLGSSAFVAQAIAGNMIAFRRLFRIGDRVQIGDVIGDVVEMRQAVTHIRTIKNQEVIVPNTAIVNSNVVNYSSLARKHGLILHTTVTIGYDTPWRQVSGLLVLAAERTAGLRKDPAPFVLQRSLDDFYVAHELNVYTDRPNQMVDITSELHRNILDAFNEYGVQIMSPHYWHDPSSPKVVPRDQWHQAPARRPEDREP